MSINGSIRVVKVLRRINLIIRSKLDDWLVAASGMQPGGLQAVRVNALYGLQQIRSWLLESQTVQLYLLAGASAQEATPLRVLFASDHSLTAEKTSNYLGQLIFDPANLSCKSLENLPSGRLQRELSNLARREQADLVIHERNRLWRWMPKQGEWMLGPVWTRMVYQFDPQESWETIRARMNRHKQNIRRMEKSQLVLEFAANEVDFEFFYHRMHTPMVKQRHTTYARLNTYDNLLAYFKRGMLVFVSMPDGQRVAGALMLRVGDVVFGVCNGVLDGSAEWINRGAMAALYYRMIEWCHQNQIRACDMGESHPLEGDGLYLHKRRWGFQPERNLWDVHEWLFWTPPGPQAEQVRRWLLESGYSPQHARTSPGLLAQRRVEPQERQAQQTREAV